MVVFEREKSSLGLVRLRTLRAVEELERLFAISEGTPGMPPPTGKPKKKKP